MASDEVGGVADEHLLDDDVVAETGESMFEMATQSMYCIKFPILF